MTAPKPSSISRVGYFHCPPDRPTGGGTVYIADAQEVEWFKRFPTGGTANEKAGSQTDPADRPSPYADTEEQGT